MAGCKMVLNLVQMLRKMQFTTNYCVLFKWQDVFLMVRRKKTSIFLDAKESTTVLELKKIVKGITKRAIEDMKLYKDDQVSVLV